MRCAFVSLLIAVLSAHAAGGAALYVSPDVPTDDPSGGTAIYLPWEIVRAGTGSYESALLLPEGTALDALHRMNCGDWLLSVEAPVELPPGGGVFFEPGDVIRHDGATFVPFLDAESAGIPKGVNVDAAFLLGGDAGDLVVSFDVPTTIGTVTYDPADLVRYTGGAFIIYFDASATTPPVPTSSNVTGADVLADRRIVVTFDVPTTLGGVTFLPGEFVTWESTSGFASYRQDPGWPLSSRADACGMLAAPGRVGPTLRVSKSLLDPNDISLSWAPSCSVGGESYGIYEGILGVWYSHTALECLGTGPTGEISPSTGNRYYLVVPRNPDAEGSYGVDWNGTERSRGAPSVCSDTQELEPCP